MRSPAIHHDIKASDLSEHDLAERRMDLARQILGSNASEKAMKEVYDRLPKFVPAGVDINKNMEKVKGMGVSDIYNSFRNKGEFDYKQQGSEYPEFGNWHYGFLVPEKVGQDFAEMAAGYAQIKAGTSPLGKEAGIVDVFTDKYHGDDVDDVRAIRKGKEAREIANREKEGKESKARAEVPKSDADDKPGSGDRARP